MADELTLGELGRRLDDRLTDIKDDIRGIGARLDSKVDAPVLALQQAAQDERHQALAALVADLRKAREADARSLRDTRRWLVGAVVVPILAVILPLLLTRGKL